MLNRFVRALLLLPVLAGSAAAESVAGTHLLAVRWGAAVPLTRDTNEVGIVDSPSGATRYYPADAKVGSPGFDFGAQYLYNLRPSFALGLDFDYNATQARAYDVISYRYDSRPRDLKLLAVGKYSWLPEYRLRPFALAGAGFGRFWFKQTQGTAPGQVRPDGSTTTETLMNNSSTGFAWAFGAGADADLTERLVLTLDLRWSQLAISRSRFFGDKYQGMNASLQFGYRIGKI